MSDPRDNFRAAILASLGSAPDDIEPGKLHRFSTNGKRGDVSGWCKLFADGRGGVFGDYRQGFKEQWSAGNTRTMSPSERAEWARQVAQAAQERDRLQRQQWAENARRNLRTWAQCRNLTAGDPVVSYLRNRLRVEWLALPSCLRFHPALPYWENGDEVGHFPAMVAAITAPSGELLALHRTYLTHDGRKADVSTVKKVSSASGPLAGGCIRLGEPRGGVLGIAEGIETALAASLSSRLPVCSAYSAGALAGFCWPSGVRVLAIFADADKAGREAAQKLRDRAMAAAVRVNVVTPTTEGADWCDVWAARGACQSEQVIPMGQEGGAV